MCGGGGGWGEGGGEGRWGSGFVLLIDIFQVSTVRYVFIAKVESNLRNNLENVKIRCLANSYF